MGVGAVVEMVVVDVQGLFIEMLCMFLDFAHKIIFKVDLSLFLRHLSLNKQIMKGLPICFGAIKFGLISHELVRIIVSLSICQVDIVAWLRKSIAEISDWVLILVKQ